MSAESLKNGIQIEWKDLAPCSRRAEYLVSKDIIDKEFAEALKEVAKQAQLPGFRKGKAPLPLIRSRFGEIIVEDVAKHIQGVAFEKATEDKGVDIVAIAPEEAPAMPKQGEDYKFFFTFDVVPEIKLPEYKGMKVDAPKTEPVEERLAKRLQYLKGLYADYKTVEDAAKAGDMLKASYTSDFKAGEEAGPAVQRLASSDEAWLWLSQPEQIPGSIKALEGVKAGESRDFEAVFPADFKEAAFAGKTVKYSVKVAEIQRRTPVETDEQLAEKLRAKDVAEMNENIKKAVEAELDEERKRGVKEKILETLVTLTPEFPFPKSFFDSYTERELGRMAEKLVKSEADVEKFKQEKDKHLEEARKTASSQLKRFFILRKIANAEGVKVEREEVDNHITGLSSYYGYKEKDVRKALGRNGGYDEIQTEILMNKTLDLIASQAQLA